MGDVVKGVGLVFQAECFRFKGSGIEKEEEVEVAVDDTLALWIIGFGLATS
jgi:hypothetical protein